MSINEFRQDIVSGEWVLFATLRAKRGVRVLKCEELNKARDNCPFEDPEGHGNKILKTYPRENSDGWFAKVVNNKYPAVDSQNADKPVQTSKKGPFSTVEANGFHEVVIFGDHDKLLTEFDEREMAYTFRVYRDRYNFIAEKCKSDYILIFNNHGSKAGGTLYHPHSQIISTPVTPPDFEKSIKGAERFYLEYRKKVYDAMIEWEVKESKRIIAENDNFISFCPFVSRTPYEMRVFPKDSSAHFEKISDSQIKSLGQIASNILAKMDKALDRPDYNFFIHTSPLHKRWEKPEDFYTWHIEIVPKISLIGGFEVGSGIYINIIDPDQAAEKIRKA